MPLFTITGPVLATATPATKHSLAISPGTTPWLDNDGISLTSASLTVDGDVSIATVGILGGLQASGSVVEIHGSGFTANTLASIDGVPLSSVQFVNPQRLDLTLATAAVLDFRRVAVTNPGGTEVAYSPVLHGSPVSSSSQFTYANIQPIFPLQS